MQQAKVSVIIPVYNTRAYVRQAVESILQQTLTELEVILINDGSTDQSGEILHQLAQQDARVRVYEQQNQGQSVARNKGTQHAKGEYLYFMDSDDLLEADALEVCYNKCVEQELDFACFDATVFNEEGVSLVNLHYDRQRCILEEHLYTGRELMQRQLEQGKYTPSPCLNLIRRAFFVDKGLSFYPGIIHEDQLFNALFYLQATRGMYINRPFFRRRVRPHSTMTTPFAWRNMHGYLTVTRELLRFSTQQSAQVQSVINLFLKQMLNAAVWQAHKLPFGQRLRLLCVGLFQYPQYISWRTLLVLLFKKHQIHPLHGNA